MQPSWEASPPIIDFDEASRIWRLNKYRDQVGMRYFRAEGDQVFVNTGMRWREGIVTKVGTNTVEVDIAGKLMRGVSDARTHVHCFASTQFVERYDGDGYDLRPNRRCEKRHMLVSRDRVRRNSHTVFAERHSDDWTPISAQTTTLLTSDAGPNR